MGGILGMFVGRVAKQVPTVIGQAFGGGYYAGQISTAGNGVADYYLIIAPVSTGQSIKLYKTSNSDDPGTSSLVDGYANSQAIYNAAHPAAEFCRDRSIGGFNDWYLPAKNELEICYYNLKPNAVNNVTFSGINANSVPKRNNNYTTSNPAITSASDFLQSGGAQAFINGTYFSSSQTSSLITAWTQDFQNGSQLEAAKANTAYFCRAMRKVAV